MKDLHADTVISNLQSFLCELYTLKKHVLSLVFCQFLLRFAFYIHFVKFNQLLSDKIDCFVVFFLESQKGRNRGLQSRLLLEAGLSTNSGSNQLWLSLVSSWKCPIMDFPSPLWVPVSGLHYHPGDTVSSNAQSAPRKLHLMATDPFYHLPLSERVWLHHLRNPLESSCRSTEVPLQSPFSGQLNKTTSTNFSFQVVCPMTQLILVAT